MNLRPVSILIQFLFILMSLFMPDRSSSQEWIRIYGQGKSAQGNCVIEDYDKGYNILGTISNYKFAWLFKTDINGDTLWDKRFGNAQIQVGTSNIEKTHDGGYIFCGTWSKFNPSFDAFLIRLNACAEIEWCKTLITPTNYDIGIRVHSTHQGDFLLLGAYYFTDPISNTSLFKFNSDGDLIWQQFYPMDSIYFEDQPADLLVDNNGYLIISSRYFPDPGSTGPAWVRHYFIKTDTAGNQLWDLVYGANDYFYGWPYAARVNTSGNYYEVGSQIVLGTGHAPAFVKVLHNGTQSYNATLLTGTLYGGLSSADFFNDSLLIMVGGWTSNNMTHDAFFKTDTLGNVKKIKDIFHITNGYGSTAKTFDNKFISIGIDATGGWKAYAVKVNSDLEYDSIYTHQFTYDSLCPYPIVSTTIDPDCDNAYVGVEEPFKNPETTRLKVYPNPTTDYITIEMPKYLVVRNTAGRIPSTTVYHQWGSALLQIYDLFGEKMFEKKVIRAETTLEIDVSRWSKGLYLCRLTFNKQTVGSSKVLVE